MFLWLILTQIYNYFSENTIDATIYHKCHVMIRKFDTKEYGGGLGAFGAVDVEGDIIKLPFWGINMIYTSKNCIPFLYRKGRTGKDFVFLGKRGSSHADALWENRKELNFWGFSLIHGDYLCGRIWCVNSLAEDAPLGLITVWDENCKAGYVADAETMRVVSEKFKENSINISDFEIITQNRNENDPAVYSVPLSDYIRLRLSGTNELARAYESQERKRRSGGGMRPDLMQFANPWVSPELGRKLTTTWGDGKVINKPVLNENEFVEMVKAMVVESIRLIIRDNNKKQ